jgi:predicted amidohydrolase
VLGTALAQMGAELMVSPCAWAVPPTHDEWAEPYGREWIDAYSTLARRHGMATVGVSYVGCLRGGAWNGWPVIGRSLAMGADGEIVARGPFGESAEALVVADMALHGGEA